LHLALNDAEVVSLVEETPQGGSFASFETLLRHESAALNGKSPSKIVEPKQS